VLVGGCCYFFEDRIVRISAVNNFLKHDRLVLDLIDTKIHVIVKPRTEESSGVVRENRLVEIQVHILLVV